MNMLKLVSFLVPFLIGMKKRMKIPNLSKMLPNMSGMPRPRTTFKLRASPATATYLHCRCRTFTLVCLLLSFNALTRFRYCSCVHTNQT